MRVSPSSPTSDALTLPRVKGIAFFSFFPCSQNQPSQELAVLTSGFAVVIEDTASSRALGGGFPAKPLFEMKLGAVFEEK
jgi:hypothetical protein